ncbi:hypothetical protein DSM106972_025540 [Dulcicalothrix desertica PCC 7102]|uniref:Uncharacterized protein n=1 Tax=Dulcicalothrix desertica PCC 7102 TaxID=232991 RepID=A0A3S1ARI4_9CYAN|nr:hypothetical protein [Dulcicalothrix desertica]RUT07293.1 hypothetical protein DSM106972_025540 [Dulcicalothrix desertica PCC 7102]
MKSQNVCTIVLKLNIETKEAKVTGTDIYFGSDEWNFLMKYNGYFSLYCRNEQINFSNTTTGVYAYYKGKKKYVTRFFEQLTINKLIEITGEIVG